MTDASAFRNVFLRSLNAMLIADDARRYVDVNSAACRLLRRSREELLTMTIGDLTPPVRDPPSTQWETFMANGVQAGGYELLLGDGNVLKVEYSAVANFSSGRHLVVFTTPTADEKPHDLATDPSAQASLLPVSGRECEVLSLIALGATSRQIADQLTISPDTVRTHVRNVMARLGAKTRAQAIAVAIQRGLIERD